MIKDLFGNFFNSVNIFDLIVILILVYFSIQCYLKGFSLSLISFMKWVLSTIITIILVPKLQPTVKDYIESEFVNNAGLGLAIFFITLFVLISHIVTVAPRLWSNKESGIPTRLLLPITTVFIPLTSIL